MKKKYLVLVILSMLMVAGYSQRGREDTKVVKDGKHEQTEALVNSKNFIFKAKRAIPGRGNSIDLATNPNYVKFEPDVIESYMPFFGRAYMGVGYGNDTGLHFKGHPDVFTIEQKKKNFQVTVNVKGESDNFRLLMTVSPGGNTTLTISSNNRESISYMGEVTPLQE